MKPKKRKSELPKSILEKSERYAQIQISTDPETKKDILNKIDRLRTKANKNIDEKNKKYSKSDIALEALKLGLKELKNEI